MQPMDIISNSDVLIRVMRDIFVQSNVRMDLIENKVEKLEQSTISKLDNIATNFDLPDSLEGGNP